MSDLSVSGIGSGAAAQGRGVDYSRTILGVRSLLVKQAKKAPEKLINLDDLKTGDSVLYPLFTKKVGEVVQRAGNDYVALRNQLGSDVKARNAWELSKQKYQDEINQYRAADAEAKRVINSSANEYYLPQRAALAQAVNNVDLTGDQWATLLNKPDQGMFATNTYGIAADLVPNADFQGIANKFNKNPVFDKSSLQFIPHPSLNGKGWASFISRPSDENLNEFAQNMINDPDLMHLYERKYRPNLDYKNPDFYSEDNDKRRIARLDEGTQFAKSIMTARVHDPQLTDAYNPPQETQKEKEKQWTTEGNTYHDGNNIWIYSVDDNGTERYTFKKKSGKNPQMEFPGGVVGTPMYFEYPTDKPAYLVVSEKKKTPIKNSDGSIQKDANGNEKTTTTPVLTKVRYDDAADAITASFGDKTIFDVRKAVTGSLEKGKNQTGSVKESSTTSAKKSSGEVVKYDKNGKGWVVDIVTKKVLRAAE